MPQSKYDQLCTILTEHGRSFVDYADRSSKFGHQLIHGFLQYL